MAEVLKIHSKDAGAASGRSRHVYFLWPEKMMHSEAGRANEVKERGISLSK